MTAGATKKTFFSFVSLGFYINPKLRRLLLLLRTVEVLVARRFVARFLLSSLTKRTHATKMTTAKHYSYVSSSGTTRSRKPLFRPTAIADVFWTLLDVLVAFFRTLLSLDHAQKYGTKAGDVNAPRGGGGGGRRGGGNNGTRRYGGSNIHGIDHNATPPSA